MDLKQHLARQMAFSRGTFGPGERRKGVIDHIRKELDEIEAGDGDPREWVDVVILAMDGLWRSIDHRGLVHWEPAIRVQWENIPNVACGMIEAKQAKNEQRNWPDWRTMSEDKAIEHDRTSD